MAEKTNADNNSLAKISFVSVPYATISDSAVKVSDEDIVAYINKHPKQFKQKDETRQISYITFEASPSKQDTSALLAQMEQTKLSFNQLQMKNFSCKKWI